MGKSILAMLGVIGVIMGLTGCSDKVTNYQGTQPVASLSEYFSGPIKAWGIVQDRKGHVIQRVEIDMVGKWSGDKGTLSEVLKYSDGRVENRTWNLTKISDTKFKGTAEGIVGEATGESNGFAMRWNYVMTIPVDGKNYDIVFDDWMYQMNDTIMVNRSYMSKFGIRVAEISIFMQKQ